MSMIGIVVASHGDLSRALIHSVEMIVGSQAHVEAVCLDPKDTLETCQSALQAAIDQADSGDGVLVLIDLFGGTPSNAAALGLSQRSYAVVTGVNLPMILEVMMVRRDDLSITDLAALALQAGYNGIIDVGTRLEAQQHLPHST
jgi:PTS system mannose-specific IIA component